MSALRSLRNKALRSKGGAKAVRWDRRIGRAVKRAKATAERIAKERAEQ